MFYNFIKQYNTLYSECKAGNNEKTMPDVFGASGMAVFLLNSAGNRCYFVFTGVLNFGPK